MRNYRIISALIVFLVGISIVSCTNSRVYKGDRFYDGVAYSKAIPFYEKVYKKHPEKVGGNLAEAYYLTGQSEDAEKVYKELIERGTTDQVDYTKYAKVLMMNDKHEEAQEVLQKYVNQNPNNEMASRMLESTEKLNDRFRDTTLYELTAISLPDFTNTYSTTKYKDKIVFVADKQVGKSKQSAWTGNSYVSLYETSVSNDGTWSSPKELEGNINGKYHEGPAVFTKDGEKVFFTRSNYTKRKLEVNDENTNNLKLFTADFVDNKWVNLEELPFNSDDYSVGHPTLSPTEDTLYFISDMPGGLGGTDLYYSVAKNGTWSAPVNLGTTVNTAQNEMFPYYHHDGALYFSSEGHNSMGGLDVFETELKGDSWAKPENLNYPVNSTKDDFAFLLEEDGTFGYLSSARSGDDKIYTFVKNPPTFNLIGFVHEKGNRTPMPGATIEVTNQDTGDTFTLVSDEEGNFSTAIDHETIYKALASKEDHFSKSEVVSTKGLKYSEDIYVEFEIEKMVIDEPIEIENIFYDFDKWNIRADAAVELDKLVKILNDNPNIEIELGSHTDSRGTDAYNQNLSNRRAKSVVDYLVKRGIDKNRLTWKGYGESKLVNGCKDDVPCSEADHQKNRRTEFTVTKINK